MPRPRNQQTERAGAVFGGAVGYSALVAFDILIGERLIHGGGGPLGSPDRWLELAASWLLIAWFAGAFFGLLGGLLAVKLRNWRAREWPDFRTAAVGGFLLATAVAAFSHLP